MVSKVEHIGIVVKDLKKSLLPYQKLLGMALKETEEIEFQGNLNRVAFLPIAGLNIELVETSATRGMAADFLRERGEGIHHIAFEVPDLEKTFQELQTRGVKFVGDRMMKGSRGSKVAFFQPEEFSGVFIELVQKH